MELMGKKRIFDVVVRVRTGAQVSDIGRDDFLSKWLHGPGSAADLMFDLLGQTIG